MVPLIFNLIAIPASVILAGYGLRQLASQWVPQGILRFWLYPGVAVHELSHAAACLPAMAKIKSITLFRADGSGEVVHEEPKVPVIGMLAISLAPLAGGVLVMVLLNWLLGNPLQHYGAVSGNAAESWLFIGHLLEYAWKDLIAAFSGFDITNWRAYVLLLAVVSVSLTMVPSPQDMQNGMKSAMLVLVVVILWMLVAQALDFGSGVVVDTATWLLGYAHIAYFYYAITLLVLLLLAGIGKLTGR